MKKKVFPLAASVIIPTFERAKDVAAAVASAAGQTLPRAKKFEIIVVDDGGKDQSAQAIARLAQRFGRRVDIHYYWKENAGPAAARNFGARHARGQVLVFFDSDALAQPGWLAQGLKALEQHPDWAGVEGCVKPTEAVAPSPFIHQVDNIKGGRWLTCNLFMRRQAFEDLGGFDERFPRPVREDTEFAFRALSQGLVIGFAPQAQVLHPVKRVSVRQFFHHAWEGQFEALLERRHPRLYRQHLKWIDGRAIPAYYWPHYAALVGFLLAWPLGLVCLGAGMLATLYAWCRKKQIRLGEMLALILPALLVPYLRLFWVLAGYFRYFLGGSKPHPSFS